MFPYVSHLLAFHLYICHYFKANGWFLGCLDGCRGTKCLVFLKRGDDSNFPFSWLFKLRLFSASELRLPCFWWWSPPFNSSRFSRIRLPPPSLYVCTMISTWSKKTRASIHGKSCCNLLQRLMGVDCARGLWLVAALNESHDSRVRKEQHIKRAFLRQCKWPCDLNFHEDFTDFSQNLNIQFFLLWEEHSFLKSKTGNDGKNSIWNVFEWILSRVIHEVRWWWPP